MLHAQGERIGDSFHHLVEVKFLLLERGILTVEHRHLQHLFHQEAQTLCLVINHSAQMAHHLRTLRHRIVVHHLCGQRDAGDRSLQLMRHVVDEVVLNF